MRKPFALLLVLVTAGIVAQEKSSITVKDTTVATGAIIVTIETAGKSVDLQCTQGMPACTELKAGKYLMVQLPKNRGLYDCQNVDVYPADTQDPAKAQRLGAYCLMPR